MRQLLVTLLAGRVELGSLNRLSWQQLLAGAAHKHGGPFTTAADL